jgi:hypothetical protein
MRSELRRAASATAMTWPRCEIGARLVADLNPVFEGWAWIRWPSGLSDGATMRQPVVPDIPGRRARHLRRARPRTRPSWSRAGTKWRSAARWCGGRARRARAAARRGRSIGRRDAWRSSEPSRTRSSSTGRERARADDVGVGSRFSTTPSGVIWVSTATRACSETTDGATPGRTRSARRALLAFSPRRSRPVREGGALRRHLRCVP